MIKFRLLGLATLLLVWTAQGRAQFAHAEHKQIVDALASRCLCGRRIWGIGWCLRDICGCSRAGRNRLGRFGRW